VDSDIFVTPGVEVSTGGLFNLIRTDRASRSRSLRVEVTSSAVGDNVEVLMEQ